MYYHGTYAAHPLLGRHRWKERYQAYTRSHGRGERKEEGRTIMIMGENERIGCGGTDVTEEGEGEGTGERGR